MVFDLEHARQFLATASLPPQPEVFAAAKGMEMPALETSRQQSLVVGSNVVSFTTGVEADVRQAITDSSLFAQLAAAKAVGTNTDPLVFFDAYFSNLVEQAEPAWGDWSLPVHLCLPGSRSRPHGASHGVLPQGRQHLDTSPVLQIAKRPNIVAAQHGRPLNRCWCDEGSATTAVREDERLSRNLHRGR